MSLPPYFDDRSKVREVAVWAAATLIAAVGPTFWSRKSIAIVPSEYAVPN